MIKNFPNRMTAEMAQQTLEAKGIQSLIKAPDYGFPGAAAGGGFDLLSGSGVDLYVDDTKAGSNLTFPNNSSYLSVDAGTRDIALKVAGTSTTVLSASLPLSGNINDSVFVIDSVSKLGALVLTDDLTSPAMGKAHVRFVHLSPNAPAVDRPASDVSLPMWPRPDNARFREQVHGRSSGAQRCRFSQVLRAQV